MQTFSELTAQEQQELYVQVINLKKEGFGYKRIINKIKEEQVIRLSLSTLSYWFNHKVKLLGGQNYFEPIQSSELSYVLGVMFGDGSIIFNKKRKEYVLRLEATDNDFVEKFSFNCAIILKKEKSFAVCYNKSRSGHSATYSTQVRSKQLYYFVKSLKNDFEKVKKFVEKYPAEFIRGLADSEGCPSISANIDFSCNIIVAYSTNYILLNYVKKLLEKLEILSNLRLSRRKGAADSVIQDRLIIRTMDLYSLSITRDYSVKKFSDLINFSINRKYHKLIYGVWVVNNFIPNLRLKVWNQKYRKIEGLWIRRTQT